MKHTITSPAEIKKLVDAFYKKVNADILLSPVFNVQAKTDWQSHLEQMYKFWNMQLLGIHDYRGNPFFPHSRLAIGTQHFDRWLQLFIETIDENFIGDVAETAKQKAKNIAAVFQYKLGLIS
jgi:hemoglobin